MKLYFSHLYNDIYMNLCFQSKFRPTYTNSHYLGTSCTNQFVCLYYFSELSNKIQQALMPRNNTTKYFLFILFQSPTKLNWRHWIKPISFKKWRIFYNLGPCVINFFLRSQWIHYYILWSQYFVLASAHWQWLSKWRVHIC